MTIFIENLSDLPVDFTNTQYTTASIDGPTVESNGATWSPNAAGSFFSLKNNGSFTIVDGQEMLVSFDLQNVDARYLVARLIGSTTTNYGRRWINLSDMTLGTISTPAGNTRIEEVLFPLNNGWSRYCLKLSSTVSEDIDLFFYMVLGDGSMSTGSFDVGKIVRIANVYVALGADGDIDNDRDVDSFLIAQGYTGRTFNDRKLQWLRNFFQDTTGTLSDLEAQYRIITRP